VYAIDLNDIKTDSEKWQSETWRLGHMVNDWSSELGYVLDHEYALLIGVE